MATPCSFFGLGVRVIEVNASRSQPCTGFFYLSGTTLGGYLGWWAAEQVGFGLMGAFLVSSLGSVIGIVVAWKVLVDYLS